MKIVFDRKKISGKVIILSVGGYALIERRKENEKLLKEVRADEVVNITANNNRERLESFERAFSTKDFKPDYIEYDVLAGRTF